jgi:hypothetical protein
MSWVERAVTHVGLGIIEKLATILEIEPAEFFRPALPVRIPERRPAEPMPSSAVS